MRAAVGRLAPRYQVSNLLRRAIAHRSVLARLTLGLGAVLVGATLAGALPRETSVELDLGADHREVVELRVQYLRDGEALSGGRFTFPDGGPPRVDQRVHAAPGALDVRVELRERSGAAREVRRRFRVPAEGTVRLFVGSAAR